jgi:hypothetical protein
MQRAKTGGRQAGTPNKVTRELRDTLKTVIAAELESVGETLASLPAKERVELLIKLMPYCMPRIESLASGYDSSLLDDW